MSKRAEDELVTESSAAKRRATEQEEEDEEVQQPISERMMLRNESYKLTMKMLDRARSRKEIALLEKEQAAIDWKLEKLIYPKDRIMLVAARERLIYAELKYVRETEKEDLSKKKVELEEKLESTSGSSQEAYIIKELLQLRSTEDELKKLWAKRETELREQIIRRNPLPWTCHVPKTWQEISTEISRAPFVINTLVEDEASQIAVLGPLFKPGTSWPVVKTSTGPVINMEFMPYRFFNPDGDDLRPAARHLCDRILRSTFIPLSAPGSGKSSALVDVGREHFVIYFQGIPPKDQIDLTGELPYGVDRNFVKMYLDLCERLSLDNTHCSVQENHRILNHRASVELVARTLQLVRLYREVGSHLTPWMFTVHQLASSDQEFVKEMVYHLDNCEERSLYNIMCEAMKELKPLFSETRKFVIAVDDIEFATDLLKERFKPPSDNDGMYPKSIISGIMRGHFFLEYVANWALLLAGTGLPVKNVPRGIRRVSIGKIQDDLTVTGLSLFPVCRKEEIVRVLSCLNISEELRSLVENMSESPWPLHLPPRKGSSTQESIKFLLEEYIVGARPGLLCEVIECIKVSFEEDSAGKESSAVDNAEGQHQKNNKTADELLLMSIEKSLEIYREGILRWYLSELLDPNHPYKLDEKEADGYLRYLLGVLVAMRLTDGNAKIIRKTNEEALHWLNLVRLGIALDVKSVGFYSNEFFFYTCRERIVVEAIEFLFSDNEQVLNSPQIASYRRILDMLLTFLDGFAKEERIFQGSLLNSIILNRLIALQRECPTIGDLPFLPPNLDSSWKSIPLNLQGIKQSDEVSFSTPDFLVSQAAENLIYVPEKSCRPDAIIMLPKIEGLRGRRAISFGIFLDSCREFRDDAISQSASADLSRSYLDKYNMLRPANEQVRRKWVENGLHETETLRILIRLPNAANKDKVILERETRVEGDSGHSVLRTFSLGNDILVRLDCSNIHLLLGPMDETNHVLYELLKVATDVTDGWCTRNIVDSNVED